MRLCSGKVIDREAAEITTFDKWLLQIGDGSFNDDVNNELIKFPPDICITSSNDPIDSIIEAELNDTIIKIIPGEGRTYFSSNNLCKASVNTNDEDLLYPPEFLSSLRFLGIPNHDIHLKVGTPVMLLRNLNQSEVLCNGTRLIVTHLGNHQISFNFDASKRQEPVFNHLVDSGSLSDNCIDTFTGCALQDMCMGECTRAEVEP
ncbi:putative protein ZINC INDUCED FACILITATOR-LIKE 1-like [Capsicum annuum]|nr:putative protein ZINC INDUCED FACILITATOR-LIKE 1-like [Capsicum annuum]